MLRKLINIRFKYSILVSFSKQEDKRIKEKQEKEKAREEAIRERQRYSNFSPDIPYFILILMNCSAVIALHSSFVLCID